MSTKRTKSQSITKKDNSFNLALLPLIIIVSILPLIVHEYSFDTNLSQFSWFPSGSAGYDFFLYYKSIWLITISSIALLPLVYKLITEKRFKKFSIAFIPLGIYALLAVLSSIFSDYSYFSFHGVQDHFESVFVLLAYCIIAFYSFIYINTEDDVKSLFKYFIIGILLISLLGLTQFTGHDFLATTVGKKMITSRSSWGNLDALNFTFGTKMVYLSFYNPNYVGLYTSLLTPIFFVLILFQKNKKLLALYTVIFLSLLLCMFGSQSRNGVVALFVSLVFVIILLRKVILKQWKLILISIAIMVIAFLVLDNFNENSFSSRLKVMFQVPPTAKALTAIDTNDDNVVITYNNEKLAVQMLVSEENNISFGFADALSGEVLQSTYDEASTSFLLSDPRFPFTFKFYSLEESNQLAFGVTIEGKEWIFTNQTEDGTYFYNNNFGKLDKIVPADSAVFTGYESIAGRGYIWSRTIPLLKEYILLGSGADTFLMAFPQQNYVDNYNYLGNEMLTKPHNLYLQIGVQTGVLSLLAFLAFYGIYFFSSMKLYLKNRFDTYLTQMGAAILVGTIGYMTSALVNDSTVTVSPIFWVLIGTGLAINYSVREDVAVGAR